MASIQILSNYAPTAANSVELAFTATTDTAIESFTASNTSGVNASYKAYIVSKLGIVQPQIPFKIVNFNTNDVGIGIVNQVIPKGGELRIETSAIDSIFFTVTGRTS